MTLTANQMELKAAAKAADTEWPSNAAWFAYQKFATPSAILALLALVEAGRADAERYRYIRDAQPNALYIDRNSDHSTNYRTAKQWIELDAPEQFEGVSADELQKMKDADVIWSVQIYPDTPIGSYSFHGATLDTALDEAMAQSMTGMPSKEADHG